MLMYKTIRSNDDHRTSSSISQAEDDSQNQIMGDFNEKSITLILTIRRHGREEEKVEVSHKC